MRYFCRERIYFNGRWTPFVRVTKRIYNFDPERDPMFDVLRRLSPPPSFEETKFWLPKQTALPEKKPKFNFIRRIVKMFRGRGI
jgi:hypothetical protein